MKIRIEKIATVPLLLNRYINDDIFSFSLDLPANKHVNQLNDFLHAFNIPDNQTKHLLEHVLIGNRIPEGQDIEDLMKLNLNHLFNANEYFTNGQKVATIINTENGFEIGFHDDIKIFASYFYESHSYIQFSLTKLRVIAYEIYEKAITDIVNYLSMIEIKRIQVNTSIRPEFVEIRHVYPFGYVIKLNNKEYHHKISLGRSLDKITKEIAEYGDLKCCMLCTNFAFSGMSHDMSGGTVGYCNYISNKLSAPDVRQSVTHIWSLCEKYEPKKT